MYNNIYIYNSYARNFVLNNDLLWTRKRFLYNFHIYVSFKYILHVSQYNRETLS